jgi:hypothetical protein
MAGERPPIPDSIPRPFATLIRQCWEQDPAQRPLFKDIVDRLGENEFLVNIDRARFIEYQLRLSPEPNLRKLKTRYVIEGDMKTHFAFVPSDATVAGFLEIVRTRRSQPDLRYVWLEGALIDGAEEFTDFWSEDHVFTISANATPPLAFGKLVSHSKSLTEVDFPFREDKSLDGIIAYLTRRHGGNVHDKGIVTITSKSVNGNTLMGFSFDDAVISDTASGLQQVTVRPILVPSDGPADCGVQNVADLNPDSYFCSASGPNQWISWDFHELRIRPTHYTLSGGFLQSWVVESSLDGVNWTEIDRKTNYDDFDAWPWTASFAVLNSAESRFIRLTQTNRPECLNIEAVEFFGTLLE